MRRLAAIAGLLPLALGVGPPMWAQSGESPHPVAVRVIDFEGAARAWSVPGNFRSDVALGESSSARADVATGFGDPESKRTWRDIVPVYDHAVRPFSEFGMALKVSTLGPGFDLVTPLLRNWNLRGSANFFDLELGVTNEGVHYAGELHLRSGGVNLDWSPRHGGFHISPGLMIFNPRVGGGISIPGGMVYTLNDQTFTSSASDPVRGQGQLGFSRRVAPSLAIGFGNIIPRSGKRWTVPVELGVAYVGHSTVGISLLGTACQLGDCVNVATDPDSQGDLQEQLREINEDLKRVQVFPILSIGVGYRF